MELRNRVLGPIAPIGREQETATVDFGDLVRRLVIFDELVLESGDLKEFPLLAQKFGYDGLKELLESRRLRIHCELLTVGEVGRTTELRSRERKGALPLGSYSFASVALADRKEFIHKCLQPINDAPGLTGRQAQKLRKLVAEAIVSPPADSGRRGIALLHKDLEGNVPALKTSVAFAAANEFDKPIDPNAFDLRVERLDDEDFRTDTNLGERLNLSANETHELVSRGLLGVAGLNQRIELMERYQAVAGFQVDELPIFEAKLNFLARQLDPDAHLKRFQRVLKLSNLPDVDPNPEVQDIDLPRLIEILHSDEAREFRIWLRSADSLDDAEVKREIGKLRELVRHSVDSAAGKVVRIGVTAGIGFVPGGQLPAIAAAAIDSLVIEKLVSEPGCTAFLSRLYPTVFVR